MLLDFSDKTNQYQDIDHANRIIQKRINDAEMELEFIIVNEADDKENICESINDLLYNKLGIDEDTANMDFWMIFPEMFMDEFSQKVFFSLMFYPDMRDKKITYEDYSWPLDFIDWDMATNNLFESIDHKKFDWNGETFIAVYDWESCI